MLIEPNLEKKQILVRAQGRPGLPALYKPVVFDSESSLWECLKDFGITKLREFGNPVEQIDEVDHAKLERWGFTRHPVSRTKREAKIFFAEAVDTNLRPLLTSAGFKPNSSKLIYVRSLKCSRQSLSFDFRNMQNYDPGIVDLDVNVHVKSLDDIAKKFFQKNDATLSKEWSSFRWHLAGTNPVFECPLEFYDRESLDRPCQAIQANFRLVLLPILESLSSPENLIQTFDRHILAARDKRITISEKRQLMRLLILAYIKFDGIKEAISALAEYADFTSEVERVVLQERLHTLAVERC